MKHFVGPLRGVATSILFAVVFALLSPLTASAQQGEGVKIRSIEVRYTGPETISRDRILAQMRTAVGQNYSEPIVEQDIRNLYRTGQLQNVRIFGQPQGDGVKVIVAVQTRAIVNEIEIEGATRMSAKSLRKRIKLKINDPVDEAALAKARQEIIDAYRARGYNDVDVQFRVDTNAARATSRVVYTINEGRKGTISRVEFEGNTAFSDRTLRKQMKTKGKTMFAFVDKSGRLDEAQLQQDLDAVREYYQNKGYVDVEINDVRRERGDGRMNMVIVINEGAKYTVGRVLFKGYKTTTEEKLRAITKLKEGAVYSPKAVRDDAKTIADGYGAGGFVDLVIVPQGTPSGPNRIDVTYTIEEGSRSFVQRINIVGNTRTKDKVIRREVLIAPGDIYNTIRVDTTKKRLDNLGYFSKVETYPDDTGVPGRRDLVVEVEEKRTGSLNFGAGFSTIDEIVGFVEVAQGNFDLMNWPNFTGAGQKFRARVQYGSRRKDIIVGLTEPYFLDRRLSLGGEVFYREANFLSSVYDQRNYGFSVVARKPLGRFMSLSLEYRLENVDIFDLPNDVSEELGIEAGSRTKSQVTASWVFDTRDNPFLTRKGQRVTVTPTIAGGFLGGSTQIYGYNIEAAQYFHLPYDMILLLNAQVGSVDTWGEGDRVPIFERLFLGGTNDLRGFDFREVGPKDEDGEPIGGRSLARATVELTYPIVEKIRVAVFYDTGFVNRDAYDFSTDDLASDVGVGLRLDLPIGPIRVDYGIPIQKAGNDGGGKINFNVGYQF
ncbi:MAG TPA: outer membrane protein assembly factor BamA [Chthoniobacterales bacterium]|nr:outer membrane protein assembly factor BamA [Chthoniobacterales bacterium]